MSGASGYIDHEMAGIPGWFSAIDAWIFTGISQWQHEDGLVGDLLEIGVYKGRSAILLGHLLADSERLVLCDLFDDPSAGYDGVTLDEFLATYGRQHARPPVVYQCRSSRLGELESTRAFRMIHVDGSHTYDDVRSDIDLVADLLQGGGIVVFDDYRTLHTPGVAAAVWEAVATRGLRPLCVTHDKMYATWGTERPGTTERIGAMVATIPWVEPRQEAVCGHEVVVVLPKGHFDDPPDLRCSPVRSLLPPVAVEFARRLRNGLR